MKKRSDKYKVNKIKIFIYILILIILFIAFVILWARFVSTNGLQVNEIKVVNENLPESFYGMKIIHISDMHYGKTIFKDNLDKIIKKINFIKPDLVVFTGDLVDKDTKLTEKIEKDIISELSKIESKYGKYTIKGEQDYKNNSYMKIFSESNFTILENSYDLIYGDIDEYIYIGGIASNKSEIDIDKTISYFNDANSNKNIFKIMLLHEPDNIDEIINKQSIDLALAGHSHGGQIRIPILGGIIKKEGALKYTDNHYKIKSTEFYISYGLGTTTYPFRFLNKPSINFYRLYNK